MHELSEASAGQTSDVSGSGDAGGHPPPSTQDALELLFADHRRIDALLDDCTRLATAPQSSHADRSGLLASLGRLLTAHTTIEQELFYPALPAGTPSLDDAQGDHALISQQLVALSEPDLPADDFAERLGGLVGSVRAHVAEEELRLFPAALTLDLQALGTRMALRRGELMGDQGVD